MSLWTEFGFRENPYAVTPVPPTEEGEHLLVGRDHELEELAVALTSLDTHPTLEGENGVGKTSLVSIACYRALMDFKTGRSSQLHISVGKTFQLRPGDTSESFEREVLFAVARALIDNYDQLKSANLSVPDVRHIDSWLNAPMLAQRQASFGGFGVGGGSQPNTSVGFEEAGFRTAVTRWLSECFPSPAAGAFICVLDNLELLETSQQARTLIEGIRDSVLSLPGLRWVLCGARGIVRSAASSPRLQGYLADPMDIGPIPDGVVPEVVTRRVGIFRMHADAYVPVGSSGFNHLYQIMHSNLRNALKHAQDFAVWMKSQGVFPSAPEDKYGLLEAWLASLAEQYQADTSGVTNRGWQVFDNIVSRGGSCSPSDFDAFGFGSQPAMRPYVKQLEDSNLVVSSIDDTDQRRRTIGVTPRGWLVNYQRSGYREL